MTDAENITASVSLRRSLVLVRAALGVRGRTARVRDDPHKVIGDSWQCDLGWLLARRVLITSGLRIAVPYKALERSSHM